MSFPLRFPNHLDVIYNDAQAFRRLSPREQVLSILDLVSLGEELIRHSPRRAAIEREQERYEEAWHRAHREEFRKHGL